MFNTLALYIHWPFCLSKCPYCDFNSYPLGSTDQKLWEQAYLNELRNLKELTGPRQVTSIFFGGGTPSLMDVHNVEAIIHAASSLYPFSEDIEITLEANPTTVEAQKFQQFRQIDINRLSLGVQSLKDDSLAFLGRTYSGNDVRRAIQTARDVFSNLSFDLIYALPNQIVELWEKELRTILEYQPDHLSAYQLTIEEGTPFAQRYETGDFTLPEEEIANHLYESTSRILEEAGFITYEVSNHAKPHRESRHNLSYWRYEDYAGIGPGAHGRLTLNNVKVATQHIKDPKVWLNAVQTQGQGYSLQEVLTPETQAMEAILMGLRLSEGVNLKRLACPLSHVAKEHNLEWLLTHGFLTQDGHNLRATPEGRRRLNTVVSHIFS